jgi:hypothetical protein
MADRIEDDPEFREFAQSVRGELIPKLENSGMVVSLVPSGETDVKFAIELGFSIMLDKPIIAVVQPGTPLPDKLVRVADHIVDADVSTVQGQERLQEVIDQVAQGEQGSGAD